MIATITLNFVPFPANKPGVGGERQTFLLNLTTNLFKWETAWWEPLLGKFTDFEGQVIEDNMIISWSVLPD